MKTLAQLVEEYNQVIQEVERKLDECTDTNLLLIDLAQQICNEPAAHGKKLMFVLTKTVRYVAYVKLEGETQKLRELLSDYDEVLQWCSGGKKFSRVEELYEKWQSKLDELLLSPFAYAQFFEPGRYRTMVPDGKNLVDTVTTVIGIASLDTAIALLTADQEASAVHFERINSIILKALTT